MKTMDGLPLIDATTEPLQVILTPSEFLHAVPGNGDDCAIALGCQRQFGSPFVHVTRRMAYVALPDGTKGIPVPGIQGLWVMWRYRLSGESRQAVIDVDSFRERNTPIVMSLLPIPPHDLLGSRDKSRGRGGAQEQNRGIRLPNILDHDGVRNYSGRMPR